MENIKTKILLLAGVLICMLFIIPITNGQTSQYINNKYTTENFLYRSKFGSKLLIYEDNTKEELPITTKIFDRFYNSLINRGYKTNTYYAGKVKLNTIYIFKKETQTIRLSVIKAEGMYRIQIIKSNLR